MNSHPLLLKNNIFYVPVGNHFGLHDNKYQLVYAPLSDNAVIVTSDYIGKMEAYLQNNHLSDDDALNELMPTLLMNDPEKKAPILESPDFFSRLAILPNNTCNFTCSYCYSAQGRNDKVLDKKVLKKTLDYFIDPHRVKSKMLFIAILGGGEPMLSWDLVAYTLSYGHELCEKHGFTPDFSLVTNGSILTEEMIETIKKYKLTISISFEILKDIQNLQRSHYEQVVKNIDRLMSAGISPKLRSTITTDNVLLQTQMVQEVIERFPLVNDIMMEAVTDAESFESTDDIRLFFKNYLEHFFTAWKLGKAHGKNVECSASRNYNLLIERFCPGEFAITPDGEISNCTRITAPLDPGYHDSIYGCITDNFDIEFDRKKFKELSNDNVHSKEKCLNCFAKWHCGGGCMAHKYIYSPEVLDIICDYTRAFIKRMVLEKLDETYRENYGASLEEIILGNEKQKE